VVLGDLWLGIALHRHTARRRLVAIHTDSDEDVASLLTAAGRDPLPASSPTGSLTTSVADVVRRGAIPLRGDPSQYDALLEGIGDARVVLLGEATHGTHEFYRERAFITRRLIAEGLPRGRPAGCVPRDRYRSAASISALGDFGRPDVCGATRTSEWPAAFAQRREPAV
jgi:hypothetical protein